LGSLGDRLDARSVLKEALVRVRRELKQRGFDAKGTTFHRKIQDGNVVVLSIQKSVKSTSVKTEVTLNYGVYSTLVGGKLQDDPSSATDVMNAHWRKRLSDGGDEKWLSVAATDSPDDCAQRILDAADSALPELLAHSTNTALRDEWLAGASPGLTDMQRLLCAAVVVNELGPVERVRDVVAELRALVAGSVHEHLVERQLTRAGVQVKG
jgi:hypothetical protein